MPSDKFRVKGIKSFFDRFFSEVNALDQDAWEALGVDFPLPSPQDCVRSLGDRLWALAVAIRTEPRLVRLVLGLGSWILLGTILSLQAQ